MGNNWPKLIKAYRETNGLKQFALATQLGVDQSTISRWENGRDLPGTAIQLRLRELLRAQEDMAPAIAIVRSLPSPGILMDRDTYCYEVSDPMAELLGKPREALVGTRLAELCNGYLDDEMAELREIDFFEGSVAYVEKLVSGTVGTREIYLKTRRIAIKTANGVVMFSTSTPISAKEYARKGEEMNVVYFDSMVDA